MTIPIGAHVEPDQPLVQAAKLGAGAVQIFLSNPQDFRKPQPRDDAEELKDSPVRIYVHAPYLINVASPNNRVRVPSRKILQDTCDAAAAVGATAVIVHAGHAEDDIDEGIGRWKRTLEIVRSQVPILIENTAGGHNAMARRFDVLKKLWDAVAGSGAGFCLDTCHTHAAGEQTATAVERIKSITGRIDLLHCNDSKDPAGSGRDRHQNLGEGLIGRDVLVDMIRAAGAPVICETPGDGIAGDLEIVREAVNRR